MSNANYDENLFTFKSAFDAETDLNQYGPNSLSIFALSLYLRLEDTHEFAADAITEGPNDKKIDICYVDEGDNRAIIAQSYLASNWGKNAAKANKASDLNTAIAWLLSANEDQIPDYLRTKATELRRSLASGSIRRIEIVFIHNCFESQNVQDELKTVAEAARDIAKTLIVDRDNQLIVSFRELGLNQVEELYRARDSEILVDDWIEVPISGFIEEQGQGWRAILATVPGEWIREQHGKYGDRLFSANYRDYLGYMRRQGNINYEITQTAESEPVNFWVYNNGLTALTHELRLAESVRIRGLSIINGAQTTGSLSNAVETSTTSVRVLIRIVECRSKDLIDKIIRYNNTQNEIKPADRRSTDVTQRRLQSDFSRYGIKYFHRRSSTRTPRNAITAAVVAPALCAFHGDPQTAYRNAKEIFNDDSIYQRIFPSKICVEHVFLVRSLFSAIDSVKVELKR